MTTAVTTGIFTLAGFGAAAALAYLRESLADRRRSQRELRTAARLVIEEADRNGAILSAVVQVGRYLPMANAPLRLEDWSEHRVVLADLLSFDDWTAVRKAQRVIGMVERLFKSGDASRPLAPGESGHVQEAVEGAELCIRVLDGYSRSRVALVESGRVRSE